MNVLISGATGVVGSNLIPLLLNDTALSRIGIITRTVENVKFLDPRCEVILTDKAFKENVKKFNPEVAIHLASYLTSAADEQAIDYLIESNIIFGIHFLDALKGTNVKLFINTGSFSEYHENNEVYNPTYLYAATKHAFRDIIKYYSEVEGFKVVHIIPYSIYGAIEPKKKIVDILIDSLDSILALELSLGLQQLDFIHVKDVCTLYRQLIINADSISNEALYHSGTGSGSTIRELASTLESITKKKTNVIWGAKPERERDTRIAISPVKEYKEIDWMPSIPLDEGLKRLLLLKGVYPN